MRPTAEFFTNGYAPPHLDTGPPLSFATGVLPHQRTPLPDMAGPSSDVAHLPSAAAALEPPPIVADEIQVAARGLDEATLEARRYEWGLLATMCGDGEEARDAFAEIWKRNYPDAFRFAYYRVGSQELAHDLASEAFLRLHGARERVSQQGNSALGALIVTITRNLIADHRKKPETRLTTPAYEFRDTAGLNMLPPVDPIDEVLQSSDNGLLHEAIGSLCQEQKECINLRFMQGLSVADTARLMGKREGAIKTLTFRATRTLARRLDGIGFER